MQMSMCGTPQRTNRLTPSVASAFRAVPPAAKPQARVLSQHALPPHPVSPSVLRLLQAASEREAKAVERTKLEPPEPPQGRVKRRKRRGSTATLSDVMESWRQGLVKDELLLLNFKATDYATLLLDVLSFCERSGEVGDLQDKFLKLYFSEEHFDVSVLTRAQLFARQCRCDNVFRAFLRVMDDNHDVLNDPDVCAARKRSQEYGQLVAKYRIR